MQQSIPPWMKRAKEMAARIAPPAGRPFSSKKEAAVAKLYLYDEIGKDPWTGSGIDAKDVIAALDEAKGAKSLEIHINSPGGYVFEGITVYNAIRSFAGQKTVYVDGIAASIASVIALAGDKVVTNEGAMWMIHEVAGGLFSRGTADEIEADAKRLIASIRAVQENVLDVYVNATGQPRAEIAAKMAAETWMTAAEAKECGFTDEIAEPDEAEPDEEPDNHAPPPVALSPAALVALARAQRMQIHERFPGASPGQPGQPGPVANAQPVNRQKEIKR